MASLGKHHDKGFRIHWRFTIRAGPCAGEPIRGSLLLGRCTPAAAKARLRQIEDWEEAVKTGRHVPGVTWVEVKQTWLGEQALAYTEQTLARAQRVLGLYERWRQECGLACKTIEQVAERRDLTRWRDHRLDKEAGRKTVANDFSTLAELFRWCVREKDLPDNPIDRITRPRFKIKPPQQNLWVDFGRPTRSGASESSFPPHFLAAGNAWLWRSVWNRRADPLR